MVHMTGMVAFVHSARFKALAKPGAPLVLECKATQMRRTPKQVLARYDLRFTQDGVLVYEGDQAALWMKIEGRSEGRAEP
jgi:3-hydroxymyristoyl/3-hydroxydecanoyl-(acyl carrier protein) dehydratase